MSIEVYVDRKIEDCANCPLKPSCTWDCGKKPVPINWNGGVAYHKYPDRRCKVKVKAKKKKCK